jgi:DNA replication protein DnaC
VNEKGFPVSSKKLTERYSEIPILFLDDLGSERESDRIRMQYFSIIDSRVSNELPTVYTSNLDLDQIQKVLGERIASRLKISYQVRFQDKDLRNNVELPRL